MHILHIVTERGWRGGEQQVAYLLQHSQAQQITVTVCCRANSAMANYCQANNIPVLLLPLRNSLDLVSAWRIKHYVQRKKVDIVHAQTGLAASLAVWAYKFGLKQPIVVARRVMDRLKNNKWTTKKYTCPGIAKFICVSPAATCLFRASVDAPERVVTVFDGVDAQRFAQPADRYWRARYLTAGATTLVGTTCALESRKGLFTFCDAIVHARRLGFAVSAVIMGDGPLKPALERYIEAHAAKDIIHLAGYVKGVETKLKALDIFILSANEEALGSSILDAFAAGVPVIGTATGGIAAVVQHEQTGLLCASGDSEAIARAIGRYIDEPQLSTQIAAQTYTAAKSQYSAEKMAQATFVIYQSVLQTIAA